MDLESLKRQHVYVNEHSDNAIRRAVGGTQALTKAVLEGKLQNGIALVRPPGHHAGENYWRKHTILVPMHGQCQLDTSLKHPQKLRSTKLWEQALISVLLQLTTSNANLKWELLMGCRLSFFEKEDKEWLS